MHIYIYTHIYIHSPVFARPSLVQVSGSSTLIPRTIRAGACGFWVLLCGFRGDCWVFSGLVILSCRHIPWHTSLFPWVCCLLFVACALAHCPLRSFRRVFRADLALKVFPYKLHSDCTQSQPSDFGSHCLQWPPDVAGHRSPPYAVRRRCCLNRPGLDLQCRAVQSF